MNWMLERSNGKVKAKGGKVKAKAGKGKAKGGNDLVLIHIILFLFILFLLAV